MNTYSKTNALEIFERKMLKNIEKTGIFIYPLSENRVGYLNEERRKRLSKQIQFCICLDTSNRMENLELI